MTGISYSHARPTAGQLARLFDAADFPDDHYRFNAGQVAAMLESADIVVSAWADGHLVGISLCMTDRVSVCFLSAIAVDKKWQRRKIGKKLMSRARAAAGGDKVSFVAIATPAAKSFYLTAGMEPAHSAFIAPRRP